MGYSESISGFRRQERMKLMHAVLMAVVVYLCGYMIWDLQDDVRYDLSTQSVVDLGRIEETASAELIAKLGSGDRFVRVSGIVSNRGAVVKAGRMGSMLRPDRWYRQLMGGAVFLEIEVPEGEAGERNQQRFQMFADVQLEGRGRLMHASEDYVSVIDFFKQYYGYDVPAEAIVVTVDRRPGQRLGATIGSALLGLVALINILVFLFVLRRKPRVDAHQEP